jgi:hypothetical protein
MRRRILGLALPAGLAAWVVYDVADAELDAPGAPA